MHPGVSCVNPTANVSFLVEVTINTDSHSHARFAPNTRCCQKCSSPQRTLSPISKGVKVKMDRHNEVLPTYLKRSQINTGCFCVITHNSLATAARDATHQPWNREASHPCILLISYNVSINYVCTKQTSQSNNTSQQDFGTRKVYCVSNVTFHAESKYAIKIFPSPTVFVQWPF